MRSNGLTAPSYRPVADLNPTVAETLLDELRVEAIAAYCQPIETPSMSAFDRPEFHVEILVRLYVDATAADRAMQLVSTKDPQLVQGNDDLTWAQIVAGYDTPTAGEVAPWPVFEDVDNALGDDAATTLLPAERRGDADQDARTAGVGRAGDRSEETVVEERFVPPQPPPLPRLNPADKVSWLGVVGGPTVLIAAAVFSLSLPTWLILIAALGFIAGFVSLVIRMDNGEERFDDPDNGAQV